MPSLPETLLRLLAAVLIFEAAVRVLLLVVPGTIPSLAGTHAARIPTGLMLASEGFDTIYRHDPELGWTNRPRQEDGVTVHAIGTRATSAVPNAHADVLLVGDSFTFGTDVRDEETYAWALSSTATVRNHGVPGYGPGQMLLTSRRHGEDADVVIMALLIMDLERALYDHFFNPKPRFVQTDAGLQLTNVPVPTRAEQLQAQRFSPRSVDVIRVLARRLMPQEPDPSELVRAILERFLAETRASGAIPRVVALPSGYDHEPEGWLGHLCDDPACISLVDALDGLERAEVVGAGGHWNALGHRRIAQAMAPVVASAVEEAGR